MEEGVKQVQSGGHDKKGRGPMMETAHKPPQNNLALDVADAVIRMTGVGRVVDREEDTGQDENQNQRDANRTQGMCPTNRRRNPTVEEPRANRLQSEPLVPKLTIAERHGPDDLTGAHPSE